jgi:DNA-binding CsgD family transcriptional regulator
MQDSAIAQHELLRRTLKDLARKSGCAVAFGGLTAPEGTPLTGFVGTHGRSLDGLLIEASQGAGGLAMIDHKPVATTHYRESSVITHRYDREVTAEGIVSLLAVPIVVDNRVCAIIYGGHRVATQFGDVTMRETLKVAKAMQWELSVAAEVDRRLALIETDGHAPGDPDPLSRERLELREAFAELRELSRAITDPEIARRLDAVGRLVMPASPRAVTTTSLSPREIDMLAEVALGKRNSQIADRLGLTEATVKSYVSSAMRKLGSQSRYEAVISARRAGLIP